MGVIQAQIYSIVQYTRLSDSLGSGQFGNVMKGVWLLSGGSKEVAVKMLKEDATEAEKVRFLQEAAINGQFWHPNVVKLMGVVTIGEPVSRIILMSISWFIGLSNFVCRP